MRRKRPEEEERDTAARAKPGSPVTGILALQQSAGNAAVAGMLARKKDPPKDEKLTYEVDFDGDLPTAPADVFSWGGGGGPGKGRRPDDPYELTLSGFVGSHSASLNRWVAEAKMVPRATLRGPGIEVSLEKVFGNSYHAGGDEGLERARETWTIAAETMDVKVGKKEEKKP